MASYYDKDELLKFIRTDLATYYPSTYLNGILVVARDIEKKMPTEDVVPRSEVEVLRAELSRYTENCKQMCEKAKQEVAREMLNAFASFRALSPNFCKVYNEFEKKYIGE